MTDASTNPLIGVRFRVPFDEIRADQVEPAVNQLLEESRQGLESIAADKQPHTFANTMERLDRFTERLDYTIGVVRNSAPPTMPSSPR